MYQLEWRIPAAWAGEKALATSLGSRLARDDVARTLLVRWEETCVECAAPACYRACSLYQRRADGGCARTDYGIYPNSAFGGLFDFGADVRFKRWGKLETRLYGRSVGVDAHRRLGSMDSMATRTLARFDRGLVAGRAWRGARELGLRRRADDLAPYDEFVLECFSPEPIACRLMLEYVRASGVVLRHAFEIQPGHNLHRLGAEAFGTLGPDRHARLAVYPEADAQSRVVFTWLDFVAYHEVATLPAATLPHGLTQQPAPKVKCLAWDLDDTLWNGTLLEQGADGCMPRPEAVEMIRRLNERGVLQTVVSKNDHAEAWRVISAHGLDSYFLYPAINWGRKSANLRQIAERLNIGLDTLALVDDSLFERTEVQAALPQVRVYSADRVGDLLDLSEFDVPVTETSRRRRLSYLDEMERHRVRAEFGDDYLAFLRSCEMTMRIFIPRAAGEVARCLELIQRTNQLNLSKRSYSAEEFGVLLATTGILTVAIECADRFGTYGITGLAVVDERPAEPVLRDFVLSCRIAQKRVEHALLRWLALREREHGVRLFLAELRRTDRNGPLVTALEDVGFHADPLQATSTLVLTLDPEPEDDRVIDILADELPERTAASAMT